MKVIFQYNPIFKYIKYYICHVDVTFNLCLMYQTITFRIINKSLKIKPSFRDFAYCLHTKDFIFLLASQLSNNYSYVWRITLHNKFENIPLNFRTLKKKNQKRNTEIRNLHLKVRLFRFRNAIPLLTLLRKCAI